ncbi:hypothetical protein ACP275_11G123900 [Erythranthe tilingii]
MISEREKTIRTYAWVSTPTVKQGKNLAGYENLSFNCMYSANGESSKYSLNLSVDGTCIECCHMLQTSSVSLNCSRPSSHQGGHSLFDLFALLAGASFRILSLATALFEHVSSCGLLLDQICLMGNRN